MIVDDANGISAAPFLFSYVFVVFLFFSLWAGGGDPLRSHVRPAGGKDAVRTRARTIHTMQRRRFLFVRARKPVFLLYFSE